MTWTWEEIDTWLLDYPIAESQHVSIEAFNRVDGTFGRDWMEAHAASERGATVVLEMVRLGQFLEKLDRAKAPEGLIERLRLRRSDALAELEAIALVMPDDKSVYLDCEPEVRVGKRLRKPDHRVRERVGDPWTY